MIQGLLINKIKDIVMKQILKKFDLGKIEKLEKKLKSLDKDIKKLKKLIK